MTYLLASVITITYPVFNQVEVHLGGDNAAVIWCHLNRHPINEALKVFTLLLHEVLEGIYQFGLFFGDEHVHGFLNGRNLLTVPILDIPEADPLAIIFVKSLGCLSGATTCAC